jgi:hypothetical protein
VCSLPQDPRDLFVVHAAIIAPFGIRLLSGRPREANASSPSRVLREASFPKAKPAEAFASAGNMSSLGFSGCFGHIRGLGTFRALHNLEFDRISFLQRAVTIPDDRRVMYEHIGAIFSPDESISFRVIEPLHCSMHFVSP